jgi:ParB-like chromosome segregation protein Spo0J
MIGTRRRPEERHIQHVRLDKLTPHPLNVKLYGSAKPDQKLIDSIRMLGIIEPLIVTQRGQIISGHSRWQAAKIICAEDGTSEKTVYLMTMRPDHSPNDAWYTDEDRAK